MFPAAPIAPEVLGRAILQVAWQDCLCSVFIFAAAATATCIIHAGVVFQSTAALDEILIQKKGLIPGAPPAYSCSSVNVTWNLLPSPHLLSLVPLPPHPPHRLAGRRGRSRLNPCATWRPTWTWTWRETWTSSWPWQRSWGRGCTPLCSGSRFTPACRSERCSTRCERRPHPQRLHTCLRGDGGKRHLLEGLVFVFWERNTKVANLRLALVTWLIGRCWDESFLHQTWFTGSIIRSSSLLNKWIIHAFSGPPVIINASINLLPWNLAARPDRTLVGVIKSSFYSARTPCLCVMQKSSKILVRETVLLKARHRRVWGVRLFLMKGCDTVKGPPDLAVSGRRQPAPITNVFKQPVVLHNMWRCHWNSQCQGSLNTMFVCLFVFSNSIFLCAG